MRTILAFLSLLTAACRPDSDGSGTLFDFPEPTAAPELRGSGGPDVAFESNELFINCAFLPGDANDFDHHNLVAPYRGHLVMPWSPEFAGHGGISLFDMADPCNPVKVGEGTDAQIRETHAIGMIHLPDDDEHAGDWAFVNGLLSALEPGGIQTWDLSDPTTPAPVSTTTLPDVYYAFDAYARISLSVFLQYPYLYVAGADNGIYVLDVTNPAEPELIARHVFEPVLRAGGVFAMGNRLLVTSAEGAQSAVLDISDPHAPSLWPGSPFESVDRDGVARDAYHGNLVGDWALYARKEDGGGVMMMDISNPANPTFVGDLPVAGDGGGYVFYDEGFLFVGGSNAARVIDARDPTAMSLVGTGMLPGDLDTITPYGNIAILSVDEESPDNESSAVMPWSLGVDITGPEVLAFDPPDGATGVALTARVGVGFNEFVEPTSAFPGSVRLYEVTADGQIPVDGWVSAQEAIANFAPKAALKPSTTYRLDVMADGVRDINDNAVRTTTSATFTTAE